MPVTPNAGAPFPTVNAVLNVARMRVNEMLDSVDGTLLTNDAPSTQTMLSSAWTWYQNECSNSGIELQIRNALLYGVPGRASDDPALECFINWFGCSDGVGEYEAPALPNDLVNPLTVWRRSAGTPGNFQLMTQAEDGLPPYLETNQYDWRENAMFYYGDVYAQDFRIRYSTYWSDLDVMQPDALVPMRGCENALGARVAMEYAAARGGAGASMLESRATQDFAQTGQRTSRRKQRQSIRRIGYSGGSTCRHWPVIR